MPVSVSSDMRWNSAKITRNKTTLLTKREGFHFNFVLASILSLRYFVHKRVGFFLYRCYFVIESIY
jgi:hypothetical protein